MRNALLICVALSVSSLLKNVSKPLTEPEVVLKLIEPAKDANEPIRRPVWPAGNPEAVPV